MTIRPGTAADLAAIAALQVDSSWRPEEFLAYQLTVVEDGAVVAYAVHRPVADRECELLEIAVGAAQRRQGHAERLLRRLLQEYPGDWYLEVRSSNQAAQSLYQKLGFQAIGKRPNYYWNQALGKSEEGIVFHRQS